MTNFEIEAFLAIAEERNISAAATKLYINQSSLSLRLRTLEKELGCLLFIRNRGGREVILTPEGEKFLELALQHQSIIAQMLAVGKERKKLRIAAVNSVNSAVLPHVCDLFLQNEPECALEVQDFDRTAEVCDLLEHNQLDLGFVAGSPIGRNVRVEPLFKEEFVLLASKGSELPANVSVENLDVRKEVYVCWSRDFMKWHSEMFDCQNAPAILASSLTQLKCFITRPDVWMFVPTIAYYDLLASQAQLEICNVLFDLPQRQISMLLPANGSYSQEAKRFYEIFIAYCKKSYGDDIVLLRNGMYEKG